MITGYSVTKTYYYLLLVNPQNIQTTLSEKFIRHLAHTNCGSLTKTATAQFCNLQELPQITAALIFLTIMQLQCYHPD